MARYGRDYGGYGEGGPYPGHSQGGWDFGSPGYAGPRGYGRGGGYDRGWDAYPEGPGWGGFGGYAREPGPPRHFGRGGAEGGWGGRQGGRGDWQMGHPWGAESDADRVRAADIMTENPEAVTPDTTLAAVATRMRDLDVGIIPVVDNEDDFRLRGVITDRDIAVRAVPEGKDMQKAKVSEYMTEGVETVRESDHVRDVFSVMKRARVRRVPVTDREGRLVGIIAQADLAVGYAGLDLEREAEVEEVIERISEPARPRWGQGDWRDAGRRRSAGGRFLPGYDHDLRDRLRAGWRTLREEARQWMPDSRQPWR